MVLFSKFVHATPGTNIGVKKLHLELYYDESLYYLKVYISAEKVKEYEKRFCILKGSNVDEFIGHCDMARFFSDYISVIKCEKCPLVQSMMVRVDKPKENASKDKNYPVGVITIRFKGIITNKNLSEKDSESAYYYLKPSEFYKIKVWLERELIVMSILARLGLLGDK